MLLINAQLLIGAFALLSTSNLVSGAESVQDGNPGVGQQLGKCLYCQIAVVHAMVHGEAGIKTYRCLTDEAQEGDGESEMSYTIDLPAAFVNKNKAKLDTGVSHICIMDGSAIRTPFGRPNSVVIPTAATIHFVAKSTKNRQRKLAVTGTGNRTILVVRVTAPLSTQALSSAALANTTFGIGGLAYSVAAQYSSCSADKLNFAAATGFPAQITNGVTELTLSSTVTGANIFELENTMTTMVKNALNVTDLGATFSNIMFCMPTGATYGVGGPTDWLAYAFTPGLFSYFNNEWCGKLSAVMHELGHNLGLQHSNEFDIPYYDKSCMMGQLYNTTAGTPAMCFNGHKNHVLGWYNDKKIIINPSTDGAWSGKLVGFVDYKKALTSRNEYVLIVVGQLYIQYNLAEGFNFQTQDKGNRVTVVTAPGTDSESNMLGSLAVNQAITHGLYTIQTCALVAANSTIPAHMLISVRLSTQSSNNCLTSITAMPTIQPTASPTTNPTMQPTSDPTLSPNNDPMSSPTHNPTSSPTHDPTSSPTSDPTSSPTRIPTLSPTRIPTLSPTRIPTRQSSKQSTKQPTIKRTSKPR